MLAGYVNELAELVATDTNEEAINLLFNKIVNYTQYHCDTEEAYFSNLNKSDLMLHKLQHKHFLELFIQLKQEDSTKITMTLLETYLDWFVTHVRDEDIKLVQKQSR